MTLPSSGPISFNAINVELGLAGTTNKSINASDYRTLAAVASGTIDLQDFYGKSSVLISIVDATVTNTGSIADSVLTEYRLDMNGIIYHNVGTNQGNWVTPTTSASSYQARATLVSGVISGPVNTWSALSTTQSWSTGRDGGLEGVGTTQGIFTLEIRDTATATIRDTATITLQAIIA